MTIFKNLTLFLGIFAGLTLGNGLIAMQSQNIDQQIAETEKILLGKLNEYISLSKDLVNEFEKYKVNKSPDQLKIVQSLSARTNTLKAETDKLQNDLKELNTKKASQSMPAKPATAESAKKFELTITNTTDQTYYGRLVDAKWYIAVDPNAGWFESISNAIPVANYGLLSAIYELKPKQALTLNFPHNLFDLDAKIVDKRQQTKRTAYFYYSLKREEVASDNQYTFMFPPVTLFYATINTNLAKQTIAIEQPKSPVQERKISKTYYEIIGVNQNASEAEIKTAYRKKALLYHPDKFDQNKKDLAQMGINTKEQAEEHFKELSHAYSILSNPDTRRGYDESLRK